jgi:hypothetical protein
MVVTAHAASTAKAVHAAMKMAIRSSSDADESAAESIQSFHAEPAI